MYVELRDFSLSFFIIHNINTSSVEKQIGLIHVIKFMNASIPEELNVIDPSILWQKRLQLKATIV